MSRKSFHSLCSNYAVLAAMLFVMFIQVSCEMEPVPLITNGVITGRARAQSGVDPYKHDSIKVTAYGPYGVKTAITENGGIFRITELGNGTYYLEYTKEGYGTKYRYGIQVFGNDTSGAGDMRLYKKPDSGKLPTFKKAYIGKRPRSNPEITWICVETDITIYNQNKFCYQFILFMDTGENVSWARNRINGIGWDGQFNDDNSFVIYIELDALRYKFGENPPFRSGDRVYIKGYPCNREELWSGPYVDTYFGIQRYSTLDISRSTNVASFIMP